MRHFKRTAILTLALSALLFSAGGVCAWDASEEISRLKKEVPAAESFGGNGSVIWQRNNESKMLLDGSMENFRSVMIMVGETVPQNWKTVCYPTPAAGSLKIEEAAWYNPMTGMKEGSLPTRVETLPGGAEMSVVQIPDAAVGRVAVIAVREQRAKRYGVDETVNMAGPLPVWEQKVSVEVPEGMPIFWTGRDVKEPVLSKNASVTKYSWQVMNQLPWNGEGFVLNERPMVSFSSKKGVVQSMRATAEIASDIPQLQLPDAAKGDSARAGAKLIEWVNAPERTLAGVPANWVRAADNIPANGPWTPWEKTLLLDKWLKKLGWETTLWWSAKMPLTDDTPASVTLFEEPVLELAPRAGAKSSWFAAGSPFSQGRAPSSAAGAELYGLKDGEAVTKKLSAGSPSENRLALLWKLKLNAEGRADGTLEVTVTGGWSELFSGHAAPALDKLGEFLVSKVNFAIPGMSLVPKEVKEMPLGYRLAFDVSCAPGIVHGGSMLVRLPGGIPLRVSDMIGKEQKYTLRFPFVIDQKVRISTPKGFHMLQSPPLKQLGTGTSAVLNESITHWPKKAQLLADSTWTVKKREVNEKTAPLMREELAAALRWPVLDLPFRK
ncbi:MAG: hypothetical protein RRY12_05530 [Cloacibacillus sp.]